MKKDSILFPNQSLPLGHHVEIRQIIPTCKRIKKPSCTSSHSLSLIVRKVFSIYCKVYFSIY